MRLIVLAGGRGTRFYPTTKYIPKALVRVMGRPLIEHVLEPFQGLITEVIIVVNDETGDQLRAYLGQSYAGNPIKYVAQPLASTRGTWAALMETRNFLNTAEYFMVINSDDIFDREEIQKIINASPELGIGVSRSIMPKKYGGITINRGYVTGYVSHESTTSDFIEDVFCNGLYLLNAKVFDLEPVPIAGGEFGLPQTLFAHLKTMPCKAFYMNYWVSINKPDDISKLGNSSL